MLAKLDRFEEQMQSAYRTFNFSRGTDGDKRELVFPIRLRAAAALALSPSFLYVFASCHSCVDHLLLLLPLSFLFSAASL